MTITIECGLDFPSDARPVRIRESGDFNTEFYVPGVRTKVSFFGVPDVSKRVCQLQELEGKLEDLISDHFAPIVEGGASLTVNNHIARAFQFGRC